MRIMLFSREFPPGPGGLGTHAYQLSLNLTKMGWDVMVLTLQDYASNEEIQLFNQSQPFRIVRILPVSGMAPKFLYRWREASYWVKKFRPNLLLASGDRAVWLGGWIAMFKQLPWVAVGHGVEFGIPGAWVTRQRRRLTRWFFRRATGVVCVSRFTWNQMLARNVQPRAGRVILNGADEETFGILPESARKAFVEELGLQGARVLMTVGKVWERKGQDIVIRALPEILKEFPNTYYLLVGLPAKKERFMKLSEALGVAGHVRFCGAVASDKLIHFLNCCDVFVMTSRHSADGDFEGFGISVLEAALCGKPAVVSMNSGLSEAVIDGQTGIAVPEGNSQATAQAIISLLHDDDLRNRMGNAARESVLKDKIWSHRVKEYDEFLKNLVSVHSSMRAGHVAGPERTTST